MDERMHQVSGELLGRTQWKFEERKHFGLCKATVQKKCTKTRKSLKVSEEEQGTQKLL